MAKTLRTILEQACELDTWKGVAPAEKAFVKKITDNIKVIPDAAGNGDDVFKASKFKRDEKKYKPGEDIEAYKKWNDDLKAEEFRRADSDPLKPIPAEPAKK